MSKKLQSGKHKCERKAAMAQEEEFYNPEYFDFDIEIGGSFKKNGQAKHKKKQDKDLSKVVSLRNYTGLEHFSNKKKMHSKGLARGASGHTPSPRGSMFKNFETESLNTEERLMLHSARLGDIGLLKELLENTEVKLNVNCVDYMGRNALFLAVDSENLEAIEIILEKIKWECMEDALLHAISKNNLSIVRIICDHPAYLQGEAKHKEHPKDTFFRTEEKYQYPPDITPLILAAHQNNHEMIQLFISRGYTIKRPHAIDCRCDDCQVKQQQDSLKRSRSRLNAYKALASPAYIALSSTDPITHTFELRQEMKKVAQVEKEFKTEYLILVDTCMNFACELMDLCRGTQEVQAVLSDESTGVLDPLARLRQAIQYDEKKFVAHPNCQQHLTSIWYGKEMGFMLTLSFPKQLGFCLMCVVSLPFFCIMYIINPNLISGMRCPVTKFITHTISHFIFLFLLGLATFGLEEIFAGELDLGKGMVSKEVLLKRQLLQSNLRPATTIITSVQLLIIFWIIGLVWIECKQIYASGAIQHFQQYYNYMDFSILALYLSSYALRFVAQIYVNNADAHYNYPTNRAIKALESNDKDLFHRIVKEISNDDVGLHHYFMRASRFEWSSTDPQIVSEITFAIANVLSFARTSYMMPFHEVLGPLQISFGRMLGDIARFMVLFLLVLVAFMVGMTNLYRYYGNYLMPGDDNYRAASETFKGLPQTVHTLFFTVFGLIPLEKLKIKPPSTCASADQYDGLDHMNGDLIKPSRRGRNVMREMDSTELVDRVGLVMFAIYQVAVIIVLVNILIAMMSHSFEAIQGDNDVEWKFARTKLWMNYIDEGGTLPVPFNMVPTPKSFSYAYKFMRGFWREKRIIDDEEIQQINYNFQRRRENVIVADDEAMSALISKQKNTYADILQRLVRRYLFKLERERKEGTDGAVSGSEEYGDEEELSPLNIIKEHEKEEEPTIPRSFEQYPGNGFPRSRSAEAIRQLARRATLKRGTRRGSQRQVAPPSNAQLDAIQRGQRMLDARLQDLQLVNREDPGTKETVKHMKSIMTENQKALETLVKAMGAMQEGMYNLNTNMFNLTTAFRKQSTVVHEPIKASTSSGTVKTARSEGRVGKMAVLKKSMRRKRASDPEEV